MATLSCRTRRAIREHGSEGGVSYVPVRSAGSMLQVSRQRVYQLIDEDKLSARNFDGTVLVNLRSIEGRVALLQREGG